MTVIVFARCPFQKYVFLVVLFVLRIDLYSFDRSYTQFALMLPGEAL